MAEVEAKSTPATELEALAALAKAFVAVFWRRPTIFELALLWAQSAHETGGWRHVPNHNVAGLKAGPAYQGDWRWATTKEGHGAGEQTVRQRFRAYPTLEAGMRDWLDLLRRGYPKALDGARAGSSSALVEGLLHGWGGGGRYFTADPVAYDLAVWRWAVKLCSLPVAWADICAPEVDHKAKP